MPINIDAGAPAFRWMVGFGAAITVLVAVVADLIAGAHPSHTATLALVTVVVAGMRHRLAGRHEGLFATMRGAIVSQPALHAAMKVLPVSPDPGSAVGHTAAETSMTVLHVLAAAAIAAGVAGSEQLFLAVAAAVPFVHWLCLLTPASSRSRPPAPVAWPPLLAATRRTYLASVSRRGPPAAAWATA